MVPVDEHGLKSIGPPDDQLLEYAKSAPLSLVVLASHGRAGVARATLGSVADRMLHGPAPVLILRPGETSGRLLAEAGGTQAPLDTQQ